MKLIAIERETAGKTAADFQPHLRAEALRAWELYQQGVIRELYFDSEQRRAVLVLECESAASARQALASLPLVREGLITFEVIPLAPYDGFGRLFSLQ